MKHLRKILSILILCISFVGLSSCGEYGYALSRNLTPKDKEKYGISDMPDIEGHYFERQGYSVNYKSTEEEFQRNAEMIYGYLNEKYPNTLCYVVDKEAGLFGSTFTIAYSTNLESHYTVNDASHSYEFVYSLDDELNDDGNPKDPCKITLYFNNSEPDNKLHRSYFQVINDWCTYRMN